MYAMHAYVCNAPAGGCGARRRARLLTATDDSPPPCPLCGSAMRRASAAVEARLIARKRRLYEHGIMAIQHNTDGRPCGWGLAMTRPDAEAEARRQYDAHSCYPGEERGRMRVYVLYPDGTHREVK